MENQYTVNTFDRTVRSLCNEIDQLKEEVEFWKTEFERERKENILASNERLEESKKAVGKALMFALSCTDDAEGNLVITKEKRKELAENYKP